MTFEELYAAAWRQRNIAEGHIVKPKPQKPKVDRVQAMQRGNVKRGQVARRRIWALEDKGLPVRKIAERTGFSMNHVWKLCKERRDANCQSRISTDAAGNGASPA